MNEGYADHVKLDGQYRGVSCCFGGVQSFWEIHDGSGHSCRVSYSIRVGSSC